MATVRGALRSIGIVLAASTAILGASLAVILASGNFHVIVDGEAYRSGQPSPADIRRYYRDYKLATIVNLRSDDPRIDWYKAETQTAEELGIQHVDFPMSAHRPLTAERSLQLIALLKSVPKLVLIHCNAGSDRTGLASALYLAAITKAGEESAEAQLSIRYGHLALPLLGAVEMDESFETVEPDLGFLGS